MKIAIMQPYFLPYIGYFQLMNAADEFIIYDNIKYTKKGWFNRNRILLNGKDIYITLTLKNESDDLNVVERHLSEIWQLERKKMLQKIVGAYKKAPYFDSVYPIIEKIILYEDINLFRFILHSLVLIKEYLNIQTQIIISSTIPIDHTLKSEKKVIALCKSRKASIYINSIGGLELYTDDHFKNEGIVLNFLKTNTVHYKQFNNEFIPFLSILDVMMFNSKIKIQEYLQKEYTIIHNQLFE